MSGILQLSNLERGKVVLLNKPTVSHGAILRMNSKGTISASFGIREEGVFHRVITFNENMCLFMATYCADVNKADINMVLGTERITAYENQNGHLSSSVSIMPMYLDNNHQKVSVDDEILLITKFELIKYFINNYPDKSLIQCKVSLEHIHNLAKSLYSKLAPTHEYSDLTWKTNETEFRILQTERALQADDSLIEELEEAKGDLLSKKRKLEITDK